MINAHFIEHEIKNNAQLAAHCLILIMCDIFSFFSKRFNLPACGGLRMRTDNRLHEGYRMRYVNQNHFNRLPLNATLKMGAAT